MKENSIWNKLYVCSTNSFPLNHNMKCHWSLKLLSSKMVYSHLYFPRLWSIFSWNELFKWSPVIWILSKKQYLSTLGLLYSVIFGTVSYAGRNSFFSTYNSFCKVDCRILKIKDHAMSFIHLTNVFEHVWNLIKEKSLSVWSLHSGHKD